MTTLLTEFTPPEASVLRVFLTADINYQEALFCYVLPLRFPVDFPFIVSITIRSLSVNVRSACRKDEKSFL